MQVRIFLLHYCKNENGTHIIRNVSKGNGITYKTMYMKVTSNPELNHPEIGVIEYFTCKGDQKLEEEYTWLIQHTVD